MKNLLYYFIVVIMLFSCKATKKVQKVETAIAKKDTSTVVVVKETPKIDSIAITKDILNKVAQNKIDFKTFNAKIKVDYESNEASEKVTCYLSIIKDSVIYTKIAYPPFGIVFQVKVTKDSVVLINTKKNTVSFRTISYLSDVTKIPFDFKTLQDILIGNPIFIDGNIVSYRNGSDYFSVLMIGSVFKHLVSLDNINYKVIHSKLDDIDEMKSRTCDISYSKFENTTGINFSTYRKISVAEKTKLDVDLDFKQYTFNEPIAYTFTIPKSYKRK